MNPIDRQPTDVFPIMLHSIDTLDWDTFRSTFADEIALDYTSLWGGRPETLTIQELVARWQPLVTGFDATQHLTGPIVVTRADGHSATGVTTVRAYHRIVGNDGRAGTWMVSGHYRFGLVRGPDGWKIGAITLTLGYEQGDRGLADIAQRRGETRTGGRTATGATGTAGSAHVAAVRRFFELLGDKDIDTWGELWHEQGQILVKYPAEGLPPGPLAWRSLGG